MGTGVPISRGSPYRAYTGRLSAAIRLRIPIRDYSGLVPRLRTPPQVDLATLAVLQVALLCLSASALHDLRPRVSIPPTSQLLQSSFSVVSVEQLDYCNTELGTSLQDLPFSHSSSITISID